MISKGRKKVFRPNHSGSLSLCKCRRARIKEPAGRIWPAGLSLPMLGLDSFAFKTRVKTYVPVDCSRFGVDRFYATLYYNGLVHFKASCRNSPIRHRIAKTRIGLG